MKPVAAVANRKASNRCTGNPPRTSLTLSHGDGRCDVIAATRRQHRRLDGERPGDAASGERGRHRLADPFGIAGFPLVPYSNRIGRAVSSGTASRVRWREIFRRNRMPFTAWVSNGPGRCRRAAAIRRCPARSHRPERRLAVRLRSASNASRSATISLLHRMSSALILRVLPVPLAFGHHPYFPAAARAYFSQLTACGWWAMTDCRACGSQPFGKFDFSRAQCRWSAATSIIASRGWDRHGRASRGRTRRWALAITASEELRAPWSTSAASIDCLLLRAGRPTSMMRSIGATETHAMPVIAPGRSFEASIRFRAIERAR